MTTHPWQARLIVAIGMIALAFIGLIATDVRSTGGVEYWKWMVVIYALSAPWLSWYVKRKMETIRIVTIWHEVLHWAGLVAAVLLVSFFVHLGTVSRFEAGLFDLTLIALTVFLAGVYIETSFLFVGMILGLFAMMAGFIVDLLYAFLVPVLLIGAALIALAVWYSHKT